MSHFIFDDLDKSLDFKVVSVFITFIASRVDSRNSNVDLAISPHPIHRNECQEGIRVTEK